MAGVTMAPRAFAAIPQLVVALRTQLMNEDGRLTLRALEPDLAPARGKRRIASTTAGRAPRKRVGGKNGLLFSAPSPVGHRGGR